MPSCLRHNPAWFFHLIAMSMKQIDKSGSVLCFITSRGVLLAARPSRQWCGFLWSWPAVLAMDWRTERSCAVRDVPRWAERATISYQWSVATACEAWCDCGWNHAERFVDRQTCIVIGGAGAAVWRQLFVLVVLAAFAKRRYGVTGLDDVHYSRGR